MLRRGLWTMRDLDFGCWKVESSLAIARHPLVPPAYGHMYACMILYGHEADGTLLEGRATQEAGETVREDGRSSGGTHPACR